MTAAPRPRRVRSSVLIAGLLLAIAGVIALSLASRATPHLRDRVISALNGRFESDVNVESLQVGVFPRPEVNGGGLVLRQNGRTDVAPLITVRSPAQAW